jgi:hypothetical protein
VTEGRRPRSGSARLRRAAIGVIGGAGGASLVILFFALPPFSTGLWYQSEPVTAALHAVAALMALGLALALAGSLPGTGAALRHPFVILPGALGLLGLMLMPVADVPWLSWFGSPEHGKGIAWSLDFPILCAGGLIIGRYPVLRKRLAWIALVAVTLAAGLTVHTESRWQWAPFLHYDYLAYYGVFIVLIVIGWLRPRTRLHKGALAVFGLAVILLSGNRAAIALTIVVVPIAYPTLWRLQRSPVVARAVAAASVVFVPPLVATLVILGGSNDPDSSLGSRAMHWQVTRAAVRSDPAILGAGTGWGHHGDRLVAYLPVESLDFLGHSGREANWDAVRNTIHFHSHNFLSEALLSVGVLGLLLAWAIPVALPLFCSKHRIAEAGTLAALIAGLLSMWFQLPGSVPYMAFAFATMARPRRSNQLRRTGRVVLTGLALALATSQAATAAVGLKVGQTMSRAAQQNRDTEPLSAKSLADCDSFLNDAGRGGIHLATLHRSFMFDLAGKIEREDPILDQDLARLQNYFCAGRRYDDAPHSLRLESVGLIVRSELAFTLRHPRLLPVIDSHLADWGRRLEIFLDRAPGRNDMAVPYLSWRLLDEDDGAMRVIVNQLLARDRTDPVGLWFSGIVMLNNPDQAENGLARMNHALANGLERIMPVDSDLRARVVAAAKPDNLEH